MPCLDFTFFETPLNTVKFQGKKVLDIQGRLDIRVLSNAVNVNDYDEACGKRYSSGNDDPLIE